ncbi:unnamed protein product [Tilletia controversa]|nr:unnamed protein product [Tilletia controversa]
MPLPCLVVRAPSGPEDPSYHPTPAAPVHQHKMPTLSALPALSTVLESPVAAKIAAVLLAAAAVPAMVLLITISADFRAQVADHQAQATHQLEECRLTFRENRCLEPVLWTAERCRATQACYRQPVRPPPLTHIVLHLLKTAGGDLVAVLAVGTSVVLLHRAQARA